MTLFECPKGHTTQYYDAPGFELPLFLSCGQSGCEEVMHAVEVGAVRASAVECVCSSRQLMVGGCPKRRGKACLP